MIQTIVSDPDPLRCECGADEVCLAYTAPIFACIKAGEVTRVVVADDETNFGSVARFLSVTASGFSPKNRRWAYGRNGSSVGSTSINHHN